MKEKKEISWRSEMLEYIEMILGTICVVLLIFTFIARPAVVSGRSMVPTLHNGEQLIISKVMYQPKRGDIVVIAHPNMDEGEPALVKRVIATEGETVDIDFTTGEVRVDGVLLDEPYIDEPTLTPEDMTGPVTVPKGQVFVMGDNRNNSGDSRSAKYSTFDAEYILGRCVFRLTPFSKIGVVK